MGQIRLVGKCRSSPRVRERRRPSTNRRRRRRCKKVVQRGPPSSTIRHGPSSQLPPVAPTPENATTTETSSIKHHRRCDDEKLGTRRTLVRRNPRERLVRVFRRTLSKVRSSLPSAPPKGRLELGTKSIRGCVATFPTPTITVGVLSPVSGLLLVCYGLCVLFLQWPVDGLCTCIWARKITRSKSAKVRLSDHGGSPPKTDIFLSLRCFWRQ